MDMAKTYNPSEFEKEIYEEWEKNGYFKAKVDPNKLPFSIVIPPPKAEGKKRPSPIEKPKKAEFIF